MTRDDYKKIATIVVRGVSLSFIFSGLNEIGIIVSARFLEDFKAIPHGSVAFETRILLIVFYLVTGLSLFKWSRSLAEYLLQGLDEDGLTAKEDGPDVPEVKPSS
jgi:hypothetical protein